jgi:hypothetical protein
VKVRPSNWPSSKGSASARPSTRRISRDAAAADLQHPGALVDADDGAALLPGELDRDRGGAGRDVEDDVAGPRLDPRDEEAPPARVLPEREQRRIAVVGRAERREELAGVLGAGAGRHAAESTISRWG